ncbi:MAG: polysaccharide biosynthesis/export family protein [Flavobacteriales bacterium]|nr:polysaccharide biosynthesis/export family protein [Flavobacteriales bacterium]
MRKNILLMLSIVFVLGSCVSTKKLTYLQEKSEQQLDSLGYHPLERTDYKIQINDILNIDIKSLDEKATALFSATEGNGGNIQITDAIIYIKGNSVDNFGFIELPVIGEVKVEGLTLAETKAKIEKELHKYFREDAVYLKVQLAGIRFSIVGEIKRPGKYVIYQNQANIFEAIAMAGDITMVGKRDVIQIIRQMPDGVKIFEIDLTDRNVINSPYYFLQPNDVINVQPLNAKSWGIGTEGWTTFISLLTLVSTTLLIVINVQSLSK